MCVTISGFLFFEKAKMATLFNSFTASETKDGYARLCVQINLDKPLITSIRIGRLMQQVVYEGVSLLCFSYGRLGHKKESCCY